MTKSDNTFPRVFRVRQSFERPRVENVVDTVHHELARLNLGQTIQRGESVAITAGSRGIAHIREITKAIVDHVKSLGGEPFLVPSMGSHGGATPEGQRHVLETYGMTEAYCGCPIRSSMETVVVCQAAEGFPVHFDRHAFGANHVIVCGRVKPHTSFVGDIESGLMKMMLIGLGKHEGAKVYHRAIVNFSFGQIVRSVAREVLQRCRIAAGVAIVENSYDETALIEAVRPAEFEEREKELLKLAKAWLPRLPFREADVLLLDEIGKNISGAGLDTNVVGRKFNDHTAMPDEWPKIRRIAVRGLTPETHGNATGIGIAEFCRTHILEQMDRRATAINCLTANHPTAAMSPIDFATDREMLTATLATIGLAGPAEARLMWIKNTLQVAELECSEVFLPEARDRTDLTVLSEPRPLTFGADGNLAPP